MVIHFAKASRLALSIFRVRGYRHQLAVYRGVREWMAWQIVSTSGTRPRFLPGYLQKNWRVLGAFGLAGQIATRPLFVLSGVLSAVIVIGVEIGHLARIAL